MFFPALPARRPASQRYALLCTAVLACLFLGGCWSVGPDFSAMKTSVMEMVNLSPSDADDSAGFINQVAEADADVQSQPTAMTRWWEQLDDPLLNSYVERLLDQNLDLQQATQRIIQARAQLVTAHSAFLPSLSADANAGRSFANNALTNQREYTTSYDAGVTIAWQLDLFGKLRRTEEAAQAAFDASIYDREALAQSLVAALLERRVAIAVQSETLAAAQTLAATRKDSLALIKRRYDAGAAGVTLSDVYTAQNSYDSAAADLHDYDIALSENIYALDILLGEKPGSNDPLSQDFPLLATPGQAPLCLPAALLDRRPDLKSSELLLKAANADIGIAVADLYPDLSLGGAIGYSGESTGDLFTADRLAGSVLASLTNRLFEGGALRANIRMKEAAAREQAALYAATILTAMQEVENALKAERELSAKLDVAHSATTSLERAAKNADTRYKAGLITAQELLTARGGALSAKISLLQTRQSLWNARTALYLALGGDWFGGSNTCKLDKNGQHAENKIERTPDE